MKTPLKNLLITQIKGLTDFAFEDFIKELFLLQYSEKGFIPTRRVKDKGCDGIIVNDKAIIACYGPDKYVKKDFDKKIDDDFGQYKKHWEKQYPNWRVVVNHSISPDQIQKVTSLKQDATIIGIDQLIYIIEEELLPFQVRKLAKYLKIGKEYLAKDYLTEILDELLKKSKAADKRVPYVKPKHIVEKIELNYDKKDVEEAMNEYGIVCTVFNDISSLIGGYEDDDINKIKNKIIYDFSTTKGPFKERLKQLTDIYVGKYSGENDDDYLFYIRAILIYIFEQCLIGIKTEKEKNDITASGK